MNSTSALSSSYDHVCPNRRLDDGLEGNLIWRFLNTRADDLFKNLKSENYFTMFGGISHNIVISKKVNL